VATGGAGQFDVYVLIANAHVIVDVLGYFAPPARVNKTTVISYTGQTTDSTPGNNKLLRTIGTFTKLSAATDIQIVWNSHVGGAGLACNFTIRIDDLCGVNNSSCISAVINSLSTGAAVPVSTTDIFTGLGAGLHTVSLWGRGVGATSCIDNQGNYERRVFITEY
jgi:hypothetical protein